MQVRYQAAPHTEADDYSHGVSIAIACKSRRWGAQKHEPAGLSRFSEQVADLE